MVGLTNLMASYFAQSRMTDGPILDAGCGTGTFGVVLQSIKRLKRPMLVGCDIYLPYLRAVPMNIYDDRALCTLTHLPFRDKAFKGVACIEVLEHLERDEGEKACIEFERVCRGVVAISTPKGFNYRPPSDGNPHQAHRSGWDKYYFKKRGYKIRYLPRFAGNRWSLLPIILTWRLGIMSQTLMMFKQVD